MLHSTTNVYHPKWEGGVRRALATTQILGLPWQDCPMLAIILVNVSRRPRKTPYNELKHLLIHIELLSFTLCHFVGPSQFPVATPSPPLFCFWCTTPIFSGASMWPPLWIRSGRTSLFPHSNKCQPHCLKVTGSPYKLWLMQTFTEIRVIFTTAWCMTTKNDLQIFSLLCEIL